MPLFEDLNLDYQFILKQRKNYEAQRSSLWSKRLDTWFLKLSTNGRLDSKKIGRFRRTAALISEVPRNPYADVPLLGQIYSILRQEGFKRYCYWNYKKFSELNGLDWDSFSHVGQPFFFEADGRNFNERFLRHLRTTSLVQKHINLRERDCVVDIGGGYGQFTMQLRRLFPKIQNVIIDYPEQLLLARYYISSINPELKMNDIRSIYSGFCDQKDELADFDVLLIPAESYQIIDELDVRLVCNFSSFGEMPREQFFQYLSNPAIKEADYFFSVNRIDSFPTYENKLCIFDYFSEQSDILHLGVSPVWDFYFTSLTPFFVKRHSFPSRNFEMIKKKKRSDL